MSVLDVVRKVALKVGNPVPTVLYSATDRTSLQLQELMNECATDIADAYDWQALKRIATITGDGATIGHALPSDYARMLKTANVWSSPYLWGMEHVTDTDRWLEYLVLPYRPVSGAWTIYQNLFQILPELPAADTASFFYITDQIVMGATGGETTDTATSFTSDRESFVLSERLLQLCLTYKWKQNQQQPYAEELADYERELAHEMDRDSGSKPILSGRIVSGWWRGA